jgi:hypothetical protein
MKILVCGSTRLRNAEKLIELLDELHEQSTITCLVNGGARGADLLASQWAHSKSITVKRFKVESGPISDDLTRKASDRQIRTITYSFSD